MMHKNGERDSLLMQPQTAVSDHSGLVSAWCVYNLRQSFSRSMYMHIHFEFVSSHREGSRI